MCSLRALLSSSDTSILCHLGCPTHFLSNQLKTPLKIHPHLPSTCMPLASYARSPQRTPGTGSPRTIHPHLTKPQGGGRLGVGVLLGLPLTAGSRLRSVGGKVGLEQKTSDAMWFSTRPSSLSPLLLVPLTSPAPPPHPAFNQFWALPSPEALPYGHDHICRTTRPLGKFPQG